MEADATLLTASDRGQQGTSTGSRDPNPTCSAFELLKKPTFLSWLRFPWDTHGFSRFRQAKTAWPAGLRQSGPRNVGSPVNILPFQEPPPPELPHSLRQRSQSIPSRRAENSSGLQMVCGLGFPISAFAGRHLLILRSCRCAFLALFSQLRGT